VVKVLDFGIAKLLQGGRQANQTVVGARIGTAMYMSPEQLEGREASPCSDIYALGLVLIEMLTGRLPWGKTGTETDQAVTMLRLINPPKRLREMCAGQVFSLELQKLLDDLLAFEQAQRPVDAGDLIRRLGQVPEAAPLALRSSSRRTEGSQMFEAAYLKASLKSELVADTPLTGIELPASTLPIARRSADTPTPFLTPVPTVVTASLSSDRNQPEPHEADLELPSAPTVVTASRPDMPRFGATSKPVPAAFDAQTPPAGSDLPSVPTVVTPSLNGGRLALATTLPASFNFGVGKPQEPATQPLPMARRPKSSDNNTIRSFGSAMAGLRAKMQQSPRARASVLVSGLIVGLLIGVALLSTRRDISAMPQYLHSEAGQSDRRPLAVKSTPPSKPPVVIPTTEFPLSVGFNRKRHPRAQVQCGPRSCLENCQLGPGEVCTARLPGFKSRQYSYEELKPLAQAGRVDVEVRLNR
jgi:hypothetical protein